jgi:hypothetical protein
LLLGPLPGNKRAAASVGISDPERLGNFYGRENPPVVRYVRERKRLDYGKAHEDEYFVERWER